MPADSRRRRRGDDEARHGDDGERAAGQEALKASSEVGAISFHAWDRFRRSSFPACPGPVDLDLGRPGIEEHHQSRPGPCRACRRRTRLTGALESDDTRHMRAALTRMGIAIEDAGPDAAGRARRTGAAARAGRPALRRQQRHDGALPRRRRRARRRRGDAGRRRRDGEAADPRAGRSVAGARRRRRLRHRLSAAHDPRRPAAGRPRADARAISRASTSRRC